MRRLLCTAVVLPAAVCGTTLPAAAEPAPPPAAQVVAADGHVDMGPRFVGGRWTIEIRDDRAAPVVWRPLENVVLHATGKAEVTVPTDPAYRFLGKAGAQVFVLPQVEQAGIVWPGWNTQDTQVATTVDREVTWTLNGVQGPGAFTLFLNSDFGKPATVFDSRKPFPQETGIDVNTHVHGNWTFDAQGTYLLDITMSAKLTDGRTVTDRGWLRVYAGDADPRSAFAVVPRTPASAVATPSAAAGSAPVSPGADPAPASAGAEVPRGTGRWFWVAGGGGLALILAVTLLLRRRAATTAGVRR